MPNAKSDPYILRGQTFSFTGDPFIEGTNAAVHHEDGAVRIEGGKITAVGPAADILAEASGLPVTHHPGALIMAGFVDCHAHYPQTPIIASYGEQLLDWLTKYTFPTEARFGDPEVGRATAEVYLEECLRNGITTAAVYCTVHPESVDAFFGAARARNLRMAAGKVLMDRNAPEELTDSAQQGYDDSKTLIERWHGKGRNLYAVTPRFAPTSTPAQLEAAGALWREHPGTLMQTHLSENAEEIAWVQKLFPEARDYLGVYEQYGLVGPGAVFGHALHLTEREAAVLRESGAALAHCPTSNTFIGSGLFDLQGLRDCENSVSVGVATDVGGGSSFSMFSTLRTAYEIAQLRGYSLHPAKAFYLATQGSAAALGLENKIGNLAPGFEADLIVLDLASRPLIAQRMARAEDVWDALFVQMILADDRAILATYAAGQQVYRRPE